MQVRSDSVWMGGFLSQMRWKLDQGLASLLVTSWASDILFILHFALCLVNIYIFLNTIQVAFQFYQDRRIRTFWGNKDWVVIYQHLWYICIQYTDISHYMIYHHIWYTIIFVSDISSYLYTIYGDISPTTVGRLRDPHLEEKKILLQQITASIIDYAMHNSMQHQFYGWAVLPKENSLFVPEISFQLPFTNLKVDTFHEPSRKRHGCFLVLCLCREVGSHEDQIMDLEGWTRRERYNNALIISVVWNEINEAFE